MNFLQQIVAQIEVDDLRELKDHCFVFPTKRATLHFRKHLIKRFDGKTMWSPQVLSIADFIQQISRKTILDPITLVFELFQVYRKYEMTLSFDRFYAWGKLLMKDFDEVDRYLVNAEKLFTHIRDYKRIEEQFKLPEVELALADQFWAAYESSDEEGVKSNFIKVWEILFPVYQEFNDNLWEENMAYEGMLYRRIAEDPMNSIHVNFSHISFAGFNALSKAEEIIIDYFQENYNAQFYWDADKYYLEDKQQEGGHFIRKNYKKYQGPNHHWIITDLSKMEKSIQMVGIPMNVGQAHYVGNVLSEMGAMTDEELEDTAIVFGDESLLFPLLYALPKNIQCLNITMGYPLKDSPMYFLLNHIIDLHKNRQEEESGTSFYSKNVLYLLGNPYLKIFSLQKVNLFLKEIEEQNRLYIPQEELLSKFKHPVFQHIFSSTQTPTDLLQIAIQVLDILFYYFKEQKEEIAEDQPQDLTKVSWEQEFIFHLVKSIKRLQEIILAYEEALNIETFWNLVREVIQSVKLPFEGEPLRGLQLMGFLETRILDFKNLFILSVNEGNMPAAAKINTYIPYNLRRAFKMPTDIENDALFAYHFYRILQRAENIHLIYNTNIENKLSAQEKSRYLLQIEYELKKMAPQMDVQKRILTSPIPQITTKEIPIVIPKSVHLISQLNNKLINDTSEYGGLSPSALATYINCSLQFYFKYLARLKEPEQMREQMEMDIFGRVLHKALELLYTPYKNQEITKAKIKKIKTFANVNEKLSEALTIENFLHTESGKNNLNRRILRRLVIKLLEKDAQDTPFKIIGIEETNLRTNVSLSNGKKVILKGIIDRIDEVNNAKETYFRILDYKTGKGEFNKTTFRNSLKAPEKYFEEYMQDPKIRSGMQAYLYTYLFHKNHPNKSIKTGIFPLKTINKGIQYLREGDLLNEEILGFFEQALIKKIEEIFDSQTPFQQAEDINRCTYCAYKTICQRD